MRYLIAVIGSMVFISLFAISEPANAATFNPGRIIDDSVFTNSQSMSVTQIQAFLNSKVSSCDTNGTKPASEFGRSDLTHAQYASMRGWSAPPYTCLKDYIDNGVSSAQLIANLAQQYQINPQVFIVTLQKESSLVTDDWPLASQYRTATGYGCPDSGPNNSANCNSQYYGFTNQLTWTAKMFRSILNQSPTWYSPYVKGSNYIQWSPTASCGGTTVNIENWSTAALYDYTPYQPNAAALNAGYGLGDSCSAYGNRNFWLFFNDWFGSTVGPNYAWQIESLAYAGGDNRIATGETETITLKARNTGRNPWYNHGSNPIKLATWEPADRTSSLFKTNRLATLQESIVNPDQVGTFVFTVKPDKVGRFEESLNLVSENVAYMPWVGFRPTIEVTNPYDWQVQNILYENGTGVMDPGTKQLVTVIAKNTGSATWSKTSGPAIKLATWNPDRESSVSATWLSKSRVSYMNESSVAPGQTAGFQFYVTMPPEGGYRYEQLNLVAEGEQWFANQDLTLYLYGKQLSWQPLWHSHSTGTANIARNTDFSVTLKVKNTGETTWRNDGSFPLLLGTSNPINRGSAFYSSSWISSTRTVKLVESSVAPGAEGTFIIPLRTPSTPGKYNEYFRPVSEGLIWLNDPRFNIYVNVL